MRLKHVALTVSDRERSAEFCATHFGLTDRIHDDDHLLILADSAGGLLALSSGDVPANLPRTNHFGFEADSAEQVHELRVAFQNAGLTETEFQESGPARVMILDPDGNRVEVYAF